MAQVPDSTALKKVLIIDDSAQIHQVYRIMLNRYKCEVITTLDGQKGLNQLTSNPGVDLLIVDMQMPAMSGMEFIRRVKAQNAYGHIPIIAVSSGGMDIDGRGTVSCAQGNLRKPFTSTELPSAIGKIFPQHKPASPPSSRAA